MNYPTLILASTSHYRAQLLERLGLEFTVANPGFDESPKPGEDPSSLAVRLAQGKAQAVASDHPDAVVIGSDQVASLDGQVLGKPGTRERAMEMLRNSSGKTVDFYTALSVVSAGTFLGMVDHTTVRFRPLEEDEIERYVDQDQPLDCAGAFKCESLGISLFRHIHSRDPTALVGLPLIQLAELLRRQGYPVP
ncbi:MAG: nucleoside triphosphate pyrophosphatase [Xanthomonadales bacterium]|nr:nucleoside triphosphate pyrophosphatase [Xanthomonadales bacterium]